MTSLNDAATSQNRLALAEVAEVGRYSVPEIRGGEKQRRRMNDMRLVVGMPVAVVACPADGMVVIKIAG